MFSCLYLFAPFILLLQINMHLLRKPAELLVWLTSLLLALSSRCSLASDNEIKTFSVGGNNSDLISTLEEIQKYIVNGSGGYFRLAIANGEYNFTGPNATALATFYNVSHISIVGEEQGSTVIHGGGEAGFVFREVNDLTLANLTFSNCSSLQNSTTTRDREPGNLSFVEFSSALYIESCSDINVESTTVTSSNAVGLAMFNNYGTNTFSNAVFSSNLHPPSDSGSSGYGGGGVILEFSFCRPGDLSCNDSDPVEVSNASFDFSDCSFTGNNASSQGLDVLSVYPHGTEHMGFGNGGGLAVYFRGRSINNSVTLRNCEISYNWAEFGGGLYVDFGDESRGNVFRHTSDGESLSVIGLNGPFAGVNPCLTQSVGGGVMVLFYYYPPDPSLWPGYYANVSGNVVEFSGTYIKSNGACWGGGVSVLSSRSLPGSPQTNSVSFNNCSFEQNKAVSSAAMDINVLRPDASRGELLTPTITDCVFSNNAAHSLSSSLIPNLRGYQFGIGALCLNSISANFSGRNYFSDNQGGGLVVSGADIFVSEGSSLVFERNNGQRGGALVVLGGGSIIMYHGALMNFSLNRAFEQGGAIYVEGELGQGDLIGQECFVRYYQPTVHPSQWNISMVFSRNYADGEEGESTIHLTSLLPCVWPDKDGLNVGRALCWPGWSYDGQDAAGLGNCSAYITTVPAGFDHNEADQMYNMTLYPGHTTLIPVLMRDDYGNPVDRVVFHVTKNDTRVEVKNTSVYITDNKISLYGIPNPQGKTPDLFLETLAPRILTTVLKVSLLPCPPGYTPEYLEDTASGGGMVRKCKCAYSMYFTCNTSDMSAQIQPGYCVRYHNSSASGHTRQRSNAANQTMIVVECPATLKTGKLVRLPSCNHSGDCLLEEEFCESISRRGAFCSRCVSGSTVDVNDLHNCVRCHSEEYHYGWFIYLLTNIAPITIFFVIVTLFRISTTSAPMYAFVFFAQVTTVAYFHNRFPWVFGLTQQSQLLRTFLLSPYAIWNLDFFIFTGVICLSDDLTPMYSLLLKYLLALYPMLLILVSYICIELYDHNYRAIVWLWRPFRACLKKFRRSWQPRTSIIDAFATFLMISYTKVTVITISLLTPTREYYVFHDRRSETGELLFYFDPQYSFFRGPHLPLGLLALFLGVVFVLVPPLFLFLYPTKVFQRCLNRCSRRSWQTVHTFADAFQGCFKNHTNNNRDYRYFSGLYLTLRVVLLLIYAVETSLVIQLLMQQILCTAAVLVFALVKPYKEAFFNKVDLSVFSLLALMNSFSFANFVNSYIDGEMNSALFAINYALGFLPLLYISVYVVYLILKWRGIVIIDPVVREPTARRSTLSVQSDNSSTPDIPDRLLHPENYSTNSPNSRTPPRSVGLDSGSRSSSSDLVGGGSEDEKATVASSNRRPSQRATEGSYFLKKARNMRNYSSTT